MTSYCCQHDTQVKVTGHKQGPHRSPSAADESRQRRREHRVHQVGGAQRLHLAWPCLPLQMPVRSNASLYPVAVGSTGPGHCRAWDKETMATDRVALSQSRPLGSPQLMTGHLRSRRAECGFFFLFFNSSFHSDQLMEDRLRRPPRISSDLQVREAGKCCPALVPGTGLDTGAGKGPAAACLDTGTQPGLSDSVFNGVKSTWFVYFSFNLGHFVSLSENVT